MIVQLRSILFLLTIVATFTLSQKAMEMSVVPNSAKEEPAELVAKEIRDDNGITTAGLIVYSDLKGLTYQSYNGVVKVNKSPGKDFLFLSPDERVVEVYCFGYVPLKIILNEYGIRLRSGQSWSIKVTGEKKLELIPVNIIVKPADAKIFIDGKDKESATSHQLTPGKHHLRVERNGYLPYSDSIDVNINNSLFNITLPEQDVIQVTFTSEPKNAKIYINDVERGETDRGLFLLPNKYQIRLSKSGYSDTTVSITVNERSPKRYSFTLAKNTGTLRLTVEPSDIEVLIDKENIGTKKEIELVPGTHKIEASKAFYYPFNEFIEIQKNKSIDRSIILQPIAGSLLFSINALDADVRLIRDGVEVQKWTGLNQLKNLMIGTYELRITAVGYEPITKQITISENQTANEDILMKRTVFGSLQVTVVPTSAKILLKQNGQIIKTLVSGAYNDDLRAGSYELDITASGYDPEIKTVVVPEGVTISEKITLSEYTPPITETVGNFFGDVGDGIGSLIEDDDTYDDFYHSGFFVGYQYGSDSGPEDEYLQGRMKGLRLGMILGDEDFSFEFTYGFMKSTEKNSSDLGFDTDWTISSIEFYMASRFEFIDLYYGFDFRIPSSATAKLPPLEQALNEDQISTSIRFNIGLNFWLGGAMMLKTGYYMDLTDLTAMERDNIDEFRRGWFAALNVRVFSF